MGGVRRSCSKRQREMYAIAVSLPVSCIEFSTFVVNHRRQGIRNFPGQSRSIASIAAPPASKGAEL